MKQDESGSKMVVMMDLEQNLFPSTASFGTPFCFHGKYYVIQYRCWCHDHLMGKGGGVLIKAMLNSFQQLTIARKWAS